MVSYDTHTPTSQKIPIHPYDPVVEEEYEILIKSWKQQLGDQSSKVYNNDYVRLAWIQLIDHYLDQRWSDSKQMFQCAQAWGARDSLSVTEAIHTMNTLSLKSMQRSLDARQELLQALADPKMVVSFELYSDTEQRQNDTNDSSLVRHTDSMSFSSSEEDILRQLECGLNPEREEHRYDGESREIMNETEYALSERQSSYNNFVEYIGRLSLCSEQETKEQNDFYKSNSPTSFSCHEFPYGSDFQSKQADRSISLRNLNSTYSIRSACSSKDCDSEVYQTLNQSPILLDNRKENDTIPQSNLTSKNKETCALLRSESSVSAFQLLGNNLTPRCKKQPRSSVFSCLQSKDFDQSSVDIKMTKNRSFPSKSSRFSTLKKPAPQKEQRSHSKILSIVGRKVSFPKLFSSKKKSTSTCPAT